MKILLITSTIGKSATGLVAERLIRGMSKEAELEIILQSGNPDELKSNYSVFPLKRIIASEFITKLCLVLFNFPLNEIRWIRKVKKEAIKKSRNWRPDIVMSLVSASDYKSLIAGYQISTNLNIPFYIHATDPMPAPMHWGEKPVLRKAIKNTIRKAFKKAGYISLSNDQMLQYQLSSLGLSMNEKTFVIHNPVPDLFLQTPKGSLSKKDHIFLYLGNTYTMRKPDALIKAFCNYASINTKAILKFVGNRNPNLDDYDIPGAVKSRIMCEQWNEEIGELIEEADVLVDLDINAVNDVFISSKLMQYIATDKVILSISSQNSPSFNFLDQVRDSVVFSNHDINQITTSMQNASNKSSFLTADSIKKRIDLTKSIRPTNTAKKIIKHLN